MRDADEALLFPTMENIRQRAGDYARAAMLTITSVIIVGVVLAALIQVAQWISRHELVMFSLFVLAIFVVGLIAIGIIVRVIRYAWTGK